MNKATPKETVGLASGLEKLMVSLSQTLENEMRFLAAQDISGITGLREEKARLVREYQSSIANLSKNPEILRKEPEETRARLRAVGQKLSTVTSENAIALKAAISSTQSLIQTVIEAARDEIKSHDSYNDPRKTPLMLGSYSPLCSPVAVDRTA